MNKTTKISTVLGAMLAAAGLYTFAADFENPFDQYIITVGLANFASKQVEQDMAVAVATQKTIVSKLEWIEKNEVKKEIYEMRKSQCKAETPFQKDYYNQQMQDLRERYRTLFGIEYHEPDCREIL